jgi:hypothetical protein
MNKKLLNLIIFFMLCEMILANHVSARMKCWTNSEGIKECGDKIPPEYTQQGYQEISKGGVVLEEKERIKTKEELKKAKKEAAIIAREKDEERNKKAHDKMLLETFASIEEIEAARDQKIEAVESTIKITQKRIIKLEYLLDDELNENTVNKQIDGENKKFNNAESLKEQIFDNKKFIKNKIDEQGKIKKTYLEYISRFKKLKGL